MKRITRIIRPIICMAVLLFAMTTAVMGCYQKETEPIDIPGRTPSGTSAPQPSATPAGEVIPSVDRQAELAEARAKNPDTVAWLYIPGAEVDDPVMQAEDNGYYLKLDENGEYAMWGCYYAHCENEIGGRDRSPCWPRPSMYRSVQQVHRLFLQPQSILMASYPAAVRRPTYRSWSANCRLRRW